MKTYNGMTDEELRIALGECYPKHVWGKMSERTKEALAKTLADGKWSRPRVGKIKKVSKTHGYNKSTHASYKGVRHY